MQEFIRVGYYVSTEYWEEELRALETPPDPPLLDRLALCSCGFVDCLSVLLVHFPPSMAYIDCRLCRNILADKPRVTRFPVDFDVIKAAPQPAEGHIASEDAIPAAMES